MKIKNINILLAVCLGSVLAFTGCSKDDGATPERVTISEVPTITTNIDPTGSPAIDMLNLAGFNGKFKVANYFTTGPTPTKVDIVVRKWRTTVSNANVKVFKTNVTTLPANFTVTAAEIAALFGVPIALGDNYDFAPDFYYGDRKFEAFPATGNGTGAGLNGMPFFSELSRFTAICKYDPAIYQGNFVVVSDAFGDFVPGEVVPLTRLSRNSFSFIDPYVTNPIAITVVVDTLNNQLSVTKQKIGDKFTWSNTYTNPNASVTKNATSYAAPCDKTLDIGINFTADQAPNGFVGQPFVLKLRKQ